MRTFSERETIRAGMRGAFILLGGALCVAACSSSSSENSPDCNTCDGNVAVSCKWDCHNEVYVNPQRSDCGAQKCVVNTPVPLGCTDNGSNFTVQVTVAECK